MKGIFLLNGTVKHYDWGGFSLIPRLLNEDNAGSNPHAEYWLGIHPLGTSIVRLGQKEKSLGELIEHLPFLLKILDVKNMLSIQVHPSKEAAAAGYEKETEAGIPQDSALRNYRDRNHKPELMVALGDFWLLHGFKPVKELEYTLLNVVELRELLPVFTKGGYSGMYEYVMKMPQKEVNNMLGPLIDNLKNIYTETSPDRSDEDYWACQAARFFTKDGNIDRGIFSIYLMNLVELKKGEGIFQPPGLPHAYLQGQNVEIMANSDNVLRGGLTTKQIAVDELLKNIKFEPTVPQVIKPEIRETGEQLYKTPSSDFRLSKYELKAGEKRTLRTGSAEIFLLTGGSLQATVDQTTILLGRGSPAAFSFENNDILFEAVEDAVLFTAGLPLAGE
jgi:mannose-6-phosphate isomerase